MGGLGEQTRPIELPNRRVSRCERVEVRGHVLFLHCGFDLDGAVREIFVNARRESTDMMQSLADQCIGASYRLQYGPRLGDLDTRSDFMRALLDKAIEIERAESAAVIAEYAAAGLVVAA